jgi:hypothetical protein
MLAVAKNTKSKSVKMNKMMVQAMSTQAIGFAYTYRR